MYHRTYTRTELSHRSPPAPSTRPPRTTRGLLACLALPLVVALVASALSAPVVTAAGLAGVGVGLAWVVARRSADPTGAADRARRTVPAAVAEE